MENPVGGRPHCCFAHNHRGIRPLAIISGEEKGGPQTPDEGFYFQEREVFGGDGGYGVIFCEF